MSEKDYIKGQESVIESLKKFIYLQTGETLPKSIWNPADKLLPPEKEEVLIVCNGYVMVGVYVKDDWMEPEMIRFIQYPVTYWMLLPEPPK